jgi:hypothetical protein
MLYALENGLELDMCDVANAFVQAELPDNEVIYMDYPPGMIGPEGHALRLRKALYGLKDSPHHFNKHLDSRLRRHGFVPCKADPCLYIKRNEAGDIVALIGCHVDDLALVGVRGELDAIKKALRTHYKLKDLGSATQLLGIKVDYDIKAGSLKLSQTATIDNLLSNFGFSDCNHVRTPAVAPRLVKTEITKDDERELQREYGPGYKSSYYTGQSLVACSGSRARLDPTSPSLSFKLPSSSVTPRSTPFAPLPGFFVT